MENLIFCAVYQPDDIPYRNGELYWKEMPNIKPILEGVSLSLI